MFAEGIIEGLQLSTQGGVELEKNVLIEDDSPGAGIGEDEKGVKAKNYDRVTDTVRVRKEIFVDDPRAAGAILAFYANAVSRLNQQTLFVSVNGIEMPMPPFEPLLPKPLQKPDRRCWYYLPLSPASLKKGRNEFIFYTKSKENLWEIFISEEKYFPAGSGNPPARVPRHSAKSNDGGKTWNYDLLGVGHDMRGEYNVRLALEQFRPGGRITSPVIDLTVDPAIPELVARQAQVKQISLSQESKTQPDTSILIEARAGSTFAISDEQWGKWKKISNKAFCPPGRFLQWRAQLRTANASVSPVLQKVTVTSEVEYADNPDYKRIAVSEHHNEKIIRGSYPYEYEKFDHPLLIELRRKYNLDEVVAGAKTEWEKILSLKTWAGRQYARRDLTGNKNFQFPDWNTLDILDGRGVFCLHHAIVFMQACLAFGIQCRHVQVNPWHYSGHEINEVWSNDYKKWIFIDPGYNYYVCDPNNNIPLSLQELQNVLCQHQKKELLIEMFRGKYIPAVVEINGDLPLKHVIGPSAMNERYGTDHFVSHHVKWMFFLRFIPRNNFFEKKHPVPLNQGTSQWPWNGYINWQDEHTPRLPHYSKYIYKKGDMYWTLNQAEYRLVHGKKEGEIIVHLDTVTPDFDTFQARIDESKWADVTPVFTWQLHKGVNRLEVRPRNRAGGEGIISHAVLSYS